MPLDTLASIKSEIPCRSLQIDQLYTFLDAGSPSIPSLIVFGQEATGKSFVVSKLTKHIGVPASLVDSRECITGRHLLECCVTACKDSLEQANYGPFERLERRCESLSALAVQLSRLLERCPRFYLIFDGVDGQREAPTTLLPALARLGDQITGLTVVFIVTYPPPLLLHKVGVPHIEFPSYDKAAALSILSLHPLRIHVAASQHEGDLDVSSTPHADDLWLWQRFCGIVWDALGRGAARDLVHFRMICERLWPPFVEPIRAGEIGVRELSKLVNRTRALFQSEDALNEAIVPIGTLIETKKRVSHSFQELSYFSKCLLIASYLASHNPPRTDAIFFMKMHEKKKRRSKKSVASVTSVAASGSASSRPLKHRKIQRRLLGAQPFVLERLLAIFHAIVPDEAPSGSADVLTEVATLTALRLLTKTVGTAEVTDGGTKWRSNVGWDYIQGLSKGMRFEVEEFLVD